MRFDLSRVKSLSIDRKSGILRSCGAISLSFMASHGLAACNGEGDPYFDISPVEISLCVGQQCEVAIRSRTCGNVHYATENFSTESIIWIFSQKINDDGTDGEPVVLQDPLDINDIPIRMVDGRPVRLIYVGVPVDPGIVLQITCVPVSSIEACDFIDSVLANIRNP